MKRLALLALLAGCASPSSPARPVLLGEGELGLAGTVAVSPTPERPASRGVTPKASRSRTTLAPALSVTGSLNWHALAKCESSNNPRAVSSSGKYRGLYQFDLTTWRSVGGTGDPVRATPAEQTRRASLLYKARGRSPWPICGRHL